MELSPARINQSSVSVRLVRRVLPRAACDRCGRLAPRVWDASRSAIDIDLDRPVLLQVTVSVHYCAACRHYFRAQPSFLRRDAVYTNRVVAKAVASVFRDGMAFTRVAQRLARDFWVRPSERMIRLWCRAYADALSLEDDYQRWVVDAFSGVLCVDEVYQDRLALLVAVDPAAPDGDRLVGYQLVHGQVQQTDVARFLERLRDAGIAPDQVITDASPLYPTVLRAVWPTAAHQLCLFHETRLVVDAVAQVIQAVRAELPKAPPIQRPMGRFRAEPPPEVDAARPSYDRRTRVALVRRLHREGYSLRAIARLTGHSRMTIPRWLGETADAEATPTDAGTDGAAAATAASAVPVEPDAPTTPGAPTIDPSGEALPSDWRARPTVPPPPAPWASWDHVHTAAEDLRAHRFLLLRRPAHLNDAERTRLRCLLDVPGGDDLRRARRCLEDWYAIPADAGGKRRAPEDARERWRTWRENPDYQPVAPLRRLVKRMGEARAAQVLAFLQRPGWETTNNGAERVARQFRHLQAACFTLRTERAIDGVIKAWASHTKHARTTRPVHGGRSQRGRRPAHRREPEAAALAA